MSWAASSRGRCLRNEKVIWEHFFVKSKILSFIVSVKKPLLRLMRLNYITFYEWHQCLTANLSIRLQWGEEKKRSIACKTHARSWGGRVPNPTCTKAVRLLEKQLDLMKSEKQADHCDQWIHDRFHFSTHCTRFSNILSTTLNWNRTRRPELDAGAPGRRNTGRIVCSALDFLKTYEGQPAIITVTWSRKSGTMIQS